MASHKNGNFRRILAFFVQLRLRVVQVNSLYYLKYYLVARIWVVVKSWSGIYVTLYTFYNKLLISSDVPVPMLSKNHRKKVKKKYGRIFFLHSILTDLISYS